MRRGLAVTAAVVAGIVAMTPAADAESSSPAPTVTITTSVHGQALPVASMTGAWTVLKPGRQATLKASGFAATGSTTTIRSTWTSAMRRGIGLKFDCEGDFTTMVPGSNHEPVAIRIQFRTPHSRWQYFGGGGFSRTSQPLSSGGQGVGSFTEFLHPVTVQWRVTVTATYDDTSRQAFRELVKAV